MVTYVIDLCFGAEKQSQLVIVKCHDTGVNLNAALRVPNQHGAMIRYIVPEGTVPILKIAKPDDTYVVIDGVVSEDAALFRLPPQCFTAAGVSRAELSLIGADGRRITTGTFYIKVAPECVCECSEESGDYVDVMSAQIRAAIDAAERAEEAAAQGSSGILELESAFVGQTIVVAETDESGKPTAWKAANFPEVPEDVLTEPQLDEAITTALTQAKESGVFDGAPGAPGQPGEPGYTPQKGVDYFDGKQGDKGDPFTYEDFTPEQLAVLKGEKGDPGSSGQDGQPGVGIVSVEQTTTSTADNGENICTVVLTNGQTSQFAVRNGSKGSAGGAGKDGVSVTHSWSGTTLNITSASGTSSVNLKGDPGEDGYTPVKGKDYFDGEDGSNGVSCTHSWNGTTLSVTSASGTTSANLKGEKGDKGDKGDTGSAGKTPVKGTDYYTAADKTEMVNAVLAALPTWTGGSY